MKNGVYEAGGTPLDLPVVSLGETEVEVGARVRLLYAVYIEPLPAALLESPRVGAAAASAST